MLTAFNSYFIQFRLYQGWLIMFIKTTILSGNSLPIFHFNNFIIRVNMVPWYNANNAFIILMFSPSYLFTSKKDKPYTLSVKQLCHLPVQTVVVYYTLIQEGQTLNILKTHILIYYILQWNCWQLNIQRENCILIWPICEN